MNKFDAIKLLKVGIPLPMGIRAKKYATDKGITLQEMMR
jgi:hypothetical protein